MPIRPLTRSSLKSTASRFDLLTHHINASNSKMVATSEQVQRLFLSTPNYAVVGASKDRQKYGNRVSGAMRMDVLSFVADCAW